jgi:hypothetical protein
MGEVYRAEDTNLDLHVASRCCPISSAATRSRWPDSGAKPSCWHR